MSVIQQTTDQTILKCENWCRLAICIVNPVKKALLAILHNTASDPSINGLPSDPTVLYRWLHNHRNKLNQLKNSKILKQDQLDQLLPQAGEVKSDSLDITLIRVLLQNFSGIKNEDGHWKEPRHDDHSIAAAIYRAANIRNRVFHHKTPDALGNVEFETMWREIEATLADLRYAEDISGFKVNSLDPVKAKELRQIHANMAEEFEKILVAYKEKCKNEVNNGLKTFVKRRFEDKTTKSIIQDFDTLVSNHDLVMVSGEVGLGKTLSAKNLRYLWAAGKTLAAKKLLYIDSKKVNKSFFKPSNASLICVSELGDILNDKKDEYLALFECVTKPITDLVIIIDGVDELPIKENLDSNFLKELQTKIENNENISALETVMGIYFGFFFPESKIIAFGRKNEIKRLEKMQNQLQKNNLSNRKSQIVLELQTFEEVDVKELISRVNCDISCCVCEKCTQTYNFVKDVEFRNIPSHLMALVKIFEYLPNPDFGRITKTKIFIITIFNLLKNHTQTMYLEDVKTFKKLLAFEKAKEFRDCIQNIAKMSFFSLIDQNVTIKVESYNENDVDYFKYEQTVLGYYDICIKVKRDILEQLDFFYIRYLDYHVILEPYHLTTMEFLASCYVHCHPDDWKLLLKPYFNDDRQTIILPYVAGLHSNENFTKDFVSEVLQNTSNRDVETYLSWLFSVENARGNLPFSSWHGLKENGQLFPSFDLLNRINEDVDVFENISKKLKEVQTLVCYCSFDFEWYDMNDFKHKFLTYDKNNYNVKSFICKYENYQIIVKGYIKIINNEQFNLLLEMLDNNKITFTIDNLDFNNTLDNTPHSSRGTKHLKCNNLSINRDGDSRTIDFLLNASSPSTATTSSPTIKSKRLGIGNISPFNDQQTEKMFSLCLSDVVNSIGLCSPFFTDGQISILEDMECKNKKLINIEFYGIKFNQMFDLPNFGNRHVHLRDVKNVTDNDVIKLRNHISPGYKVNLTNYKIISPFVPFVRKENYSRDVEHSMFLCLCQVDLSKVSPDVFANSFSMIPSLSYYDDDRIPSSHWLSLSQIDDCQLNEMRIWYPKQENIKHFFKLKTNILQLICYSKSQLKELLTHIVNDTNIELNKEIKVFVVKYDIFDWDYYEEIPLFSGKTIKDYKQNHSSYDLLVDDIRENYREGDRYTQWCCEISPPAKKNINQSWLWLGPALALGLVYLLKRR